MNKLDPDRLFSSAQTLLQALLSSPRMQAASRRPLDPAGAGGVLLLGILAGIGIGALLGWAAGDTGLGILIGAVVGIPLGIVLVYRRYREAF